MSRALRGGDAARAGQAAEDAVAARYAARGASILARNWRCAEGEIDLILRDGDSLVFVEVKRRTRTIQDDPVSRGQWRRLEAAALRYMMSEPTGDAPARFDLALVDGAGEIAVYENACI